MKHQPKRLSEVDLPIRRISEHARKDQNIRKGHLHTIHVWWATRPLASCRAVIMATMLPDPADPNCPPAFINEARQLMQRWAAAHAANASAESFKRLAMVQKDPAVLNSPIELRGALLDFIADFSPKYGRRLAEAVEKWGKWVLEEARKRLAPYYPTDADGHIPLAYICARTIVWKVPGAGPRCRCWACSGYRAKAKTWWPSATGPARRAYPASRVC